ncbi:hypothetical protein VP01_13119g1 [Puccinia sorghi]|uniref:Uncharacterized protein n=1 Tax=Puccinia sorghi TaxID=27349 RepID=A0A0L6VPM4_9BASI|nr:hypothetical protein VP01_13119g1 [Puccinia sorghi]
MKYKPCTRNSSRPPYPNFANVRSRASVAILPRIRRRLIEMTQALDPTRLQEALFPDPAMQVSWIGLVEDISELRLGVEVPHVGVPPERSGTTASRPPSFTEDVQNVEFTLEKCHFPQLRDRVLSIATANLFNQWRLSGEAIEIN